MPQKTQKNFLRPRRLCVRLGVLCVLSALGVNLFAPLLPPRLCANSLASFVFLGVLALPPLRGIFISKRLGHAQKGFHHPRVVKRAGAALYFLYGLLKAN